jgi:chloride channel 7
MVFRKKFITTNRKKIIEALFFSLATATVFYSVCLMFKNKCVTKPNTYLDRTS